MIEIGPNLLGAIIGTCAIFSAAIIFKEICRMEKK